MPPKPRSVADPTRSTATARSSSDAPPASRALETLSRDELLDLVRSYQEQGVRITFLGKEDARRIARKVRPRVTSRLSKFCVGEPEEQSKNLILEGENLQGMTTLYRYRGQVDLIIADPPYNTGNDFRYNDRWEEDPNDPELGELVSEDDGARHTKWMRFMLPRLQLMHDMLKPGGVLAICIDHRELFRLGAMLDEVFHERNRIAIINWQKTTSKNDAKHVSTTTEYVLVYARDLERARTGLLSRTEKTNRRFANPDNDPLGPWQWGDLTAATPSYPNMYAIQSPFTGEFHNPKTRAWAYRRSIMKEWLELWGVSYEQVDIKDGRAKAFVLKGWRPDNPASVNRKIIDAARKIAEKRLAEGNWPPLYWGQDGSGAPARKHHLEAVKAGAVPTTFWVEDGDAPIELGSVSWAYKQSGRNREGVEELNAIVGPDHNFDTVKPLRLFTKIIQIWCPRNGIVMDPFAGSGTTGHAVLLLNASEGASRRFILIEQGRPERGDPYARSLTANRLKRVITGDWAAKKTDALGGGFSFLALRDKVDAQALLSMERSQMTDAVIFSHYDRIGGSGLINMVQEGYRYLVARNAEGEGFFLIWEGGSSSPVFNEATYHAVVEEAEKAKLKPVYHVYARFNLYQSRYVRFYQIPNRILRDFGLSESGDPFNNESEAISKSRTCAA